MENPTPGDTIHFGRATAVEELNQAKGRAREQPNLVGDDEHHTPSETLEGLGGCVGRLRAAESD